MRLDTIVDSKATDAKILLPDFYKLVLQCLINYSIVNWYLKLLLLLNSVFRWETEIGNGIQQAAIWYDMHKKPLTM